MKNPNLPDLAKDFAAAFFRATNLAGQRGRAGKIFSGHRGLLLWGGTVQYDFGSSAQIAIKSALAVECGANSK